MSTFVARPSAFTGTMPEAYNLTPINRTASFCPLC
jgi:hypothetical protein